jgi:hypothetical protein
MKVTSVDVGRVWDCMVCACVSEEGEEGNMRLFIMNRESDVVYYETMKRKVI